MLFLPRDQRLASRPASRLQGHAGPHPDQQATSQPSSLSRRLKILNPQLLLPARNQHPNFRQLARQALPTNPPILPTLLLRVGAQHVVPQTRSILSQPNARHPEQSEGSLFDPASCLPSAGCPHPFAQFTTVPAGCPTLGFQGWVFSGRVAHPLCVLCTKGGFFIFI